MLQGMTGALPDSQHLPTRPRRHSIGACSCRWGWLAAYSDGEDARSTCIWHGLHTGESAAATEAGADEVILYTQTDFEAEVKRLTDGRGVDVVYDSVAKTTFDKSLNCLRPRGYLALFGQSSGPRAAIRFEPFVAWFVVYNASGIGTSRC